MDSIDPTYEAMPLNDPNVRSFLEAMDAQHELIKVAIAHAPLPIGNCYWNAARMAYESGGSAVHGWLINIWPGSHIEAMHHAVYKDAAGQLIDVTEGYSTVAVGAPITFLPDDRIAVSLDKLPSIPARFFPLSDRLQTQNFISACNQVNKLSKQKAELLYAAGYRCEGQFRLAYGLEPLPPTNITDSDWSALEVISHEVQSARYQIGVAIKALRNVTGGSATT